MRPSQSGKFNTKPLVDKEITAVRLNKNAALLKVFVKDLVYKGIIIPLFGDKAYNIKLDTVLEEDSKKEK